MYPVLKKCISLFIVLTFLANQCLPIYAGQTKKSGTKKKTSSSSPKQSYGSQKQESAFDKLAVMQDKVSQQVAEAASRCDSDESCVNWAAAIMKTVCKGMDCMLMWQEKFKLAAFQNQDPQKQDVTFKAQGVTYKMNLLLGARGYIRSKLNKDTLFDKKGQAISSLGYDKDLDELVSLISTFGVQSEGERQLAFKYFSGVVASEKDFCNGPNGLNRERCINQYNAVLGLAAVATTADSKAKAANQIYKLFKSYWPLYIYKDNQTIILENTFLALAAIDTDDSWAKINAMFTTDTQPTVMARGMEAVSIEFLTRTAARVKAIQTWGSTSYRNLGNADFAYVDTQEDKRQGIRTQSQKPYGNIIEDIGKTIAIEAGNGNPRAAKVASQAIAKANAWAKSRKQSEITRITNASFHWPFVVGILDGYYEFGEKFMYSADIKLLEFLRYGDFWDLNEGTQQRIQWKAWKYATLRQKKWKSGWYAPTLDKDKVTRSEQTAKATKWASYADIALIVVGAAAALRKIGVISKGMSKCLSIMKKGKKLMGKNMNFAKTAKTVTTPGGTAAKTGVVKSRAAAKSTSQGAKGTSTAAKGAGKSSTPSAKGGTSSAQGAKGGTSSAKAGGKTSTSASSSSKGNGSTAKGTGNGRKGTGKKGETTSSRSGNNAAKVKEDVTNPLDKKVQEAAQTAQSPVAEQLVNPNAPKPDTSPSLPGQSVEKPTILQRASAGVKKVGEYAVDGVKATWRAGTEGSQNLGIMPQAPSLNPFAGFSKAWKGVRAERQAAAAASGAEVAINPSNFIKAERLDASRRMAYFVGEDGKVAKKAISEKEYTQIVGSASEADTRAWASRQLKLREEIASLDKPGVEIVGRKPASPVEKTASKPVRTPEGSSTKQATASAEQAAREKAAAEQAAREKAAAEQAARERAAAEQAARERAAAEQAAARRATTGQAVTDNVSRLSSQMQGDQRRVFDKIAENLNEATHASLTPAQRARVEEAQRYFSQLTPEQVQDWNALQFSPEFQKHSALLRSPTATEHAFYVEGAGLESYFTSSAGARQAKGFIPTIVGEPKQGFVRLDLQNAFEAAERTNQPILVKITSHGEIDSAGKFYIPSRGLGKNIQVRTGDLVDDLQSLRRTTGTPEINLQLDACHSGQFLLEF